MARKDALLRLRQRLIDQRNGLRKELLATKQWIADCDVHGDSADVAYGDNEQEMHSQLAALESRELDRLDQAIQAIEEGSYGTCRICRGKIPIARLKAIPDATTCISCQRLNEQRGIEGKYDADWESAWRFEAKLHDGDLTVQDVTMDR